MTANKMPEMPEAEHKAYSFLDAGYLVEVPDHWTREQVEADRRACYLAAIEAAKACVPEEEKSHKHDTDLDVFHRHGHNACRAATLANLTALEQEAKKCTS